MPAAFERPVASPATSRGVAVPTASAGEEPRQVGDLAERLRERLEPRRLLEQLLDGVEARLDRPGSSPSGRSSSLRSARAPKAVEVRSTTSSSVPVRPPSRSDRKSSRCPAVTASTTSPSSAGSERSDVTCAQSDCCVVLA